MFTSRAEFRLHLRIDNADRRLTPHGRRVGLISDKHGRLSSQARTPGKDEEACWKPPSLPALCWK
jgi:tRNA U34 5-carboxymethylaminomethyl modifying enzyme MnmG/GidA